MTPEDWQRARPVLESALELDPAKRPSFLDESCAEPSLRNEIESLIAAHDHAGTAFFNGTIEPSFCHPEEILFDLIPGKRVGAFEILDEIARGGMGAVFRAVRADGQYKQQVAVKIVRADLGGAFNANRLRNERQILASLDHPNIAKLLDGGTTAEGLPYFVMEFIDGLPITEYCDRHSLSIDDRLKIFRIVCSAVHCAHQHLVVHRDIKPTNILVTPEGVPKLLDFGIAKILDPNLLPENVTRTAAGLWMMTPEYASPEQFRGETITTATDVYSLGLILYELLVGRRAYRTSGLMPHEIARTILEREPDKPSHAIRRKDVITERTLPPELVSKLRSDSLEKVHRRLTGDLDKIVLKALRKQREERYNSVDQLSEDIRHELEGLPVAACKDSIAYRCRKYALRHKAEMATALLIFLSLIVGIVLSVRQARIARANQRRAEHRLQQTRELAESLIGDLSNATGNGATPTKLLMHQKAVDYLQQVLPEENSNHAVRMALARSYERLGEALGNPGKGNMGDIQRALENYERSIPLF